MLISRPRGPQIRGFRNILVHQYFGVEVEVIRDVVETYLPALAESLRSHVTTRIRIHEADPLPEMGYREELSL